jgi:hypothetical protein
MSGLRPDRSETDRVCGSASRSRYADAETNTAGTDRVRLSGAGSTPRWVRARLDVPWWLPMGSLDATLRRACGPKGVCVALMPTWGRCSALVGLTPRRSDLAWYRSLSETTCTAARIPECRPFQGLRRGYFLFRNLGLPRQAIAVPPLGRLRIRHVGLVARPE